MMKKDVRTILKESILSLKRSFEDVRNETTDVGVMSQQGFVF